jgi:glucose-1-phosphate thymidylyltransferase
MLFHLIDELVKSVKIDTIILIIGYLGEQIRDAIAKAYGDSKVKFEYAEQNQTLGLGHAVYHAKKFVKDEPVLIVLGDTIFEFDLPSVLANEYSAIGVKDVEDTSRFGIVESENGFVTKMIEKPAPGTTNSKAAIAGVYFVINGQKLFKAVEYLMANDIKTKNEFQLTDALMKMVTDGEKMAVFEIENWFDCGKPETLLSTNAYLLNRDYKAEQRYDFTGTSVYTPVFIGEGVDIKNAHIGPNVTIAEGAKVKNSRVTNSIILENAAVENAELDNVVLGAGEQITGIHTNIVKADNTISSF